MNIPLLDLSDIQTDSSKETNAQANSSLPVIILHAGQVLARGTWARIDEGEIKTSTWEVSLVLAIKDLPPIISQKISGIDPESIATIRIPINFKKERIGFSKIDISGTTKSRMAKSALKDYLHLSIDKSAPLWRQSSAWAAIRLLNTGHIAEVNKYSDQEMQKLRASLAVAGARSTSRFANALNFVLTKLLSHLIKRAERVSARDTEKNTKLLLSELPALDKAEIKLLLNSPHKEVRIQAVKSIAAHKSQKKAPPTNI